MRIYPGQRVVHLNFDSDAAFDDYPIEGVVVGFRDSRVFGPGVLVQHGEYEEHIARDVFWGVYRLV